MTEVQHNICRRFCFIKNIFKEHVNNCKNRQTGQSQSAFTIYTYIVNEL